jgi:hypothetical protein
MDKAKQRGWKIPERIHRTVGVSPDFLPSVLVKAEKGIQAPLDSNDKDHG